MSFDLYVVPADSENWILDDWHPAVAGKPLPTGFAEFLDVIIATDPMDEEVGWLSVDATAEAEGIQVCMRWSAVEDRHPFVIETATRFGLAVFDPQASIHFDPRGGVNILVKSGWGYHYSLLSRATLRSILDHPEPKNPWLIVEREPHEYIQCYQADDGTLDVEYRAGGPDAHFEYNGADHALAERLIWSWCTDDDWRGLVEWKRVSFN